MTRLFMIVLFMYLFIPVIAQPPWTRNNYNSWGGSDASAADDQSRVAWSAYGREKRAKEAALDEARSANEKLKDILSEKEKAENLRFMHEQIKQGVSETMKSLMPSMSSSSSSGSTAAAAAASPPVAAHESKKKGPGGKSGGSLLYSLGKQLLKKDSDETSEVRLYGDWMFTHVLDVQGPSV